MIRILKMLTGFYPRLICENFGDEIQADLNDLMREVAAKNLIARGRFFCAS